MTLNEILTRQNIITKLSLVHGDKELPKELKVKIMRMRMAYNKIKQQFEIDSKDFGNQIISDELKSLINKTDKTEAELVRFNELNDKANTEYQEFLVQKGNEEIKDYIDFTFSEEEFADILDVNSDGEIEINKQKIRALDFMEVVHALFVK